jgi:hypothetical protein
MMDNVWLRGSGWTTVIKNTADIQEVIGQSGSTLTNAKLSDLKIDVDEDGISYTGSNGDGMRLDNCTRVDVQNVWVDDWRMQGLYFVTDSVHVRVLDCQLTNGGETGSANTSHGGTTTSSSTATRFGP